jgi:RNA-dependent RNA polymerase
MHNKLPWKELDREHELAVAIGDHFDGFHRQDDGWYGGKVHFRATLKVINERNTTPEYRIQLMPPELGPSSRLTRRYGSKNFLRVKVPRSILNKPRHDLVEFFSQHFLLCGVVYRAFYAKDETVFLVATNASTGCSQIPTHAQPAPPPLEDFLDNHNPIYHNTAQVGSSSEYSSIPLMRLRLWPNGHRALRWDFQTLFQASPSATTTLST